LIDKKIVWHGSLNVLSHTHRTDESMTRVVNASFAQAVAANMAKKHVSNEKALQTIADPENPRCRRCGARTVYNEGKFGPFFQCEDKCGWSVNLKAAEPRGHDRETAGVDADLPVKGHPCPMCKSKTILRHGRYGPFYRCVKSPACSGKCAPPRANRQTARSRNGDAARIKN
jgi:ssDNA-binding Zn-finger/Zn-ribbon topoisomerase 1